MKRRLKLLLAHPAVLLFFGFLVFFSAADCLKGDRTVSEMENRTLAQRPALTLQNLLAADDDKKYTTLYETYLNDQFLFRDSWITVKSRAESALLKTENNGVVYGNNSTMYQKFFSLSKAVSGGTQLDANIASVSQFLSRHPGKVKVMVVPSADRIESGLLPAGAPFVDEAPWMEKMAAAFGGSGTFIDTTETLTAHRNEYIYYRTDHHWTTLGAWYGYAQYAAAAGKTAVSADSLTAVTTDGFLGSLYSKCKLAGAETDTLSYYPELNSQMTIVQLVTQQARDAAKQSLANGTMSQATYDSIADVSADLYDISKLSTRDKYAMFLYGNNGFSRITGNGTGKVLIIKDSYANCFIPFLTKNYAEIDTVDLRSLKNTGIDELISENGYDDVLILYNFQSFASDTNLVLLNMYN